MKRTAVNIIFDSLPLETFISFQRKCYGKKVRDMPKWFCFDPVSHIYQCFSIESLTLPKAILNCPENLFSFRLMLLNNCNLAKVGIQIECQKYFIKTVVVIPDFVLHIYITMILNTNIVMSNKRLGVIVPPAHPTRV